TSGNYPAPLKILDVVETGITKGPDLGFLEESEAFGDLTQTTECKALMSIFKGRTECRRNKFGESKKIDLMRIALESVVPKHCIIASNTSALPITEIASVSSRPERIIGMHYFSPVEKMELLEIITTKYTNKETIALATQLGLTQNKLVVVVKDCPGFFVVRCLAPMMSEIGRLLQEGVHPDEIDKMTKNYGFPVGAATLADEVGIDVAQHVAKFLGEALGPRIGGGSITLLEEMVASGFKGRKSGKGYFVYSDSKKLFGKKKYVNEAALRILNKYQLTPVSTVSSVVDRQFRILCRYVNEAALCLEEGVISSPVSLALLIF
ncbi:unnamed protein product, partial [Onchocerca flexuosa]|uniref:3-hydroxyacyl-CoA dehydrogenase protein n=1 Tax=Onchocerca flexuosa TaxID=387005 RepID=A0A183I5S7_9BILA